MAFVQKKKHFFLLWTFQPFGLPLEFYWHYSRIKVSGGNCNFIVTIKFCLEFSDSLKLIKGEDMKKSLAQVRFCWNYFKVKWTFFEGVRRYGKNRSSLHSWYWNPMDYPRTKKMQFNHWKEMSDLRKEHQDVHFHFSTISVSKYKLQLILEWVLCWLLSQFIYIFHQFQFRKAA